MWDGDGNVKAAARDYVRYYYAVIGKTVAKKTITDMSDAEVISTLEAAFKAGVLSREERV